MSHDQPRWTRRRWLLAGSASLMSLGATARADDPRVASIRARARKANMEGFDESTTARFLGVGDSPRGFRKSALDLCETVATDYRKHLTEKGFTLAWPPERMIVVVLMGPRSYATYEGGFIDEAVGGHFDLQGNYLVTFDSGGPGADPKNPVPEVVNTFQLVHETFHLLTFNTGLLDLKADVPLVVSEGLAAYGETWGPRRRGVIGSRNAPRLLGLKQARDSGTSWVPFSALLADDKLFEDPKLKQVAYAESWLFVYQMMRDPARTARFRAYLNALRDNRDRSRRIELAATHLGELDKLDSEIKPAR